MCYHQPSYDFVYVQIEDCRTRYNGDADHHQRRKKFSFPARLICGDCYEVILLSRDRLLSSDSFLLTNYIFLSLA